MLHIIDIGLDIMYLNYTPMEKEENKLLFSIFIVLPTIIVILLSIKNTIEYKREHNFNESGIQMFILFAIGGLTNSTPLLMK